MDALAVSDQVCALPVLRPVIGMDKTEIIAISRRIGTFETSILPYEDCCTVFTPRHPKTHPQGIEVCPWVDAEVRHTNEGIKTEQARYVGAQINNPRNAGGFSRNVVP